MNSKIKRLVKNTGFLTISNFSSKLLLFLLVPLYTNILSTWEYGVYDLVSTTVQLLYPILSLNIVDAVMRFLFDKDKEKKRVISAGLLFCLISFVITGLLIAVGFGLDLLKNFDSYYMYIFFYFISYVMYQLMTQIAKGLDRVKVMSVAGVISTVITIVCNIIFLVVSNFGLAGFFLAYILGQCIASIYVFVRLKVYKYICVDIDGSLIRNMLEYSVPLIVVSLGWWINNASDRYVITWLMGVKSNGVYSIAYKIPSIIITIHTIFMQAWAITAIAEYDNNTREFYSNLFMILNVVMSAICMLILLANRLIARMLYAGDFYEAWKYVPFLLLSSVVNASAGFIGPILSAQKKTKIMARSALYGAAVNIILNVILINYIGIQGAAVATFVSSLIIFGYRYYSVKEMIDIDVVRKNLIVWGILIVQGAMAINCLEWIEIIPIIVVCLIYSKDMKNYVRTLTDKQKK